MLQRVGTQWSNCATVHGISKALLQFDSALKPELKKQKLTTRDSRSVERKKYGHRKARKKLSVF